jgi:hypothetical protein
MLIKTCESRARICKRLSSSGIDSKDAISPAYVAWRAGMSNRVVLPARQAGNRFLGPLKVYKSGLLFGRQNVNRTGRSDPYMMYDCCHCSLRTFFKEIGSKYLPHTCLILLRKRLMVSEVYVWYGC